MLRKPSRHSPSDDEHARNNRGARLRATSFFTGTAVGDRWRTGVESTFDVSRSAELFSEVPLSISGEETVSSVRRGFAAADQRDDASRGGRAWDDGGHDGVRAVVAVARRPARLRRRSEEIAHLFVIVAVAR
jgi:hypothetical protein